MAKKRKTKDDAPGADVGDEGAAAGPGHNSENGKPKLTADEMRSLFLTHRTSWNEWKAKLAVVEKIERDTKAALKADGFTVKQMQIADSLLTVKGEAKITGEVKDRLQVAMWVGHPMGAQLDLFEQPDRTPSVDRAYDNGKMASMQGNPAKPPHAPETEQYRHWLAGYHDHQRELMGGFKAPAGGSDASTLAHREDLGS